MQSSVFKIPEKSNNNNDTGATTNTTQLNRSHRRKELNKFNSLDDGEEDTEFTVVGKSRLKLPTFRKRFDQLQTID